MPMNANRTTLRNRLASPAAALAMGLATAVLLLLLPVRWTGPVKGAVATLLRPGQLGVSALRQRSEQAVVRVKSHFHTAAGLAKARRELKRLRSENRRLKDALAIPERRQIKAEEQADESLRLLRTRCIPARVLGRQARAFLQNHQILDVGSHSGIEPEALVVDPTPAIIDQGSDAELEVGQLVLSRSRVWGKVVEVGPYTSVVRAVTEPGYRDLVRLAGSETAGDDRPQGPRGIVEGTGQRLARIRLIEVTEPVAVGDLVYTAAGDGVLPRPLLYGRVVRLQRPPDAAHWEIWMQPAVAPDDLREAVVLQVQLNPLRVSRRQ